MLVGCNRPWLARLHRCSRPGSRPGLPVAFAQYGRRRLARNTSRECCFWCLLLRVRGRRRGRRRRHDTAAPLGSAECTALTYGRRADAAASPHTRATPKVTALSGRLSASRQMLRLNASTLRELRRSITPLLPCCRTLSGDPRLQLPFAYSPGLNDPVSSCPVIA